MIQLLIHLQPAFVCKNGYQMSGDETELKINPFLRTSDNEILNNLSKSDKAISPEITFAAIRKAKDVF